MPEKKHKKRPTDINVLAAQIVAEATGELSHNEKPPKKKAKPEPSEPAKNPAAVALGRLGGKKGGPARAKKLTPEQRKAIARKAADTRWAKKKSSSPE